MRLYDRDIPEIPLALDRYGAGDDAALQLCLYERPYDKEESAEAAWLDLMARGAAEALGMAPGRCFLKTRKRMRGLEQYERLETGPGQGGELVVREGGLSFIVNLSGYLDTGLFLDHRPTRAQVRARSAGAEVLNLFCYTGSFSVHAASGGAASVTSVDLSNTYLAWAGRNLELNGFRGKAYPLVRADAMDYLAAAAAAGRTWDIIVADPPTFSNSKMASGDFDVNEHWPLLVERCLAVTRPGGLLWFSSNSRRLRWQGDLVAAAWEDISEATIPPDFRDRKVHRCWLLRPRGGAEGSESAVGTTGP